MKRYLGIAFFIVCKVSCLENRVARIERLHSKIQNEVFNFVDRQQLSGGPMANAGLVALIAYQITPESSRREQQRQFNLAIQSPRVTEFISTVKAPRHSNGRRLY